MARILAITNWYPPHHYGGYELLCLDVMTRLAERGHDVRVLCSDDRLPSAEAPRPEDERIVFRELRLYMRDGALYRPGLRDRLRIERHNQASLDRHLDEFEPDVVSVWHMGALSLGLLTTISRRRIPMVYAVLDDWLTYGERLDAWTDVFARSAVHRFVGRGVEALVGVPTVVGDLGSTGAFCFISEATRRTAREHARWTLPRTAVVYAGIERRAFPVLEDAPTRPWQWRLLYFGRFDPRKGAETAIRALSLLPSEATLACFGRGDGDERSRLEQLARSLGIADRVSFGSLDRDELAEHYQSGDVVVFPSAWEEPLGLVPVEAMACGTPVLATGTGGSAEYLRDGYNCLLFRAGDAAGLAAAVERLHDDASLRRSVVLGGLHTATELDVAHFSDALEAWHLAAVERFAAGAPPERQLDLPDATPSRP